MTDVAQSFKRLVIQEPDGLMRIIDACPSDQLPSIIEIVNGYPLNLIQVKARYAVYRIPLIPEVGKFNDFHPTQA